MGLVALRGRWQRPEVVADKLKADQAAPRPGRVQGEAAQAADTADAQWTLALWCDEHGLKEQAKAHFTAVTRLDPRARPPGSGSATRSTRAAGSPTPSSPPRRPRPRPRSRPTRSGGRSWSKYRRCSTSPRARGGRGRPGRGDRPPGRPVDRPVFASGGGDPASGPCGCSARSTRPRRRGRWPYLAVFARSAEARRVADRDAPAPRPSRVTSGCLIALIREPIKYEVRPVGGPGLAGRAVRRGEEGQRPERSTHPRRRPNIALLPRRLTSRTTPTGCPSWSARAAAFRLDHGRR